MLIEGQITKSKDDGGWRRWLRTLIVLLLSLSIATYGALILVDPFSTGRFALTQRVDRVPNDSWYWFAKAGLIRDQQFDAVIIGSSVAGPLDPVHIGAIAGRRILQLALYGAFPQNLLTVSRAFERHHAAKDRLRIVILDQHWCAAAVAQINYRFSWLPEFPSWVYESSNYQYMTRIFSPFALRTAIGRVAVWLGLREHSIRADGFAPIFPEHNDPAAVAARLLAMKPDPNGPSPTAPFPHLDALADHLAMLDRQPVLLVFLPIFVNALPALDTAAGARSATCKANVAAMAQKRANTGFLDLQGDNPMSHAVADYDDAFHFRGNTSRMVEAAIAKAALALLSQVN